MKKKYFVPEIRKPGETAPDGTPCDSVEPAWLPKDAKKMQYTGNGLFLWSEKKPPKKFKIKEVRQ